MKNYDSMDYALNNKHFYRLQMKHLESWWLIDEVDKNFRWTLGFLGLHSKLIIWCA